MPPSKPTATSKASFFHIVSSCPGPTVDTSRSPKSQQTQQTQSVPTTPTAIFTGVTPRPTLHGVNLVRVALTIWIFYFHFQVFFRNTSVYSPNYNKNGGFAVELFFILSGFVLAFVYLDSFRPGRNFWTESAKFLAKRFIRIWPIHVLCTYLFYVYTPECTFDKLVSQVTLRSWNNEDGILYCNVPAWFVHQELFLCLALPGVLWLLNRPRLGLAPVCILAGVSWYVYVTQAFPLWNETFREAVVRSVPTFTTGVLLGFLYTKSRTPSLWFDLVALLLTAKFYLMLEGPLIHQEAFLLQALFLFVPALYAVARSRVINFLADNTFLRVTSNLCFGFFMFQWMILDSAKRTAWGLEPNFLFKQFKYVWPNFALFTLVWAAVFYYSVEEKLMQVAQLLCKWLDARTVPRRDRAENRHRYVI